jgi:hypothetical protein
MSYDLQIKKKKKKKKSVFVSHALLSICHFNQAIKTLLCQYTVNNCICYSFNFCYCI